LSVALPRGRPGNPPIGGFTQEEAAQLYNVGMRNVQRARVVLERGVPDFMKRERMIFRKFAPVFLMAHSGILFLPACIKREPLI
jgi:hypothetical protein